MNTRAEHTVTLEDDIDSEQRPSLGLLVATLNCFIDEHPNPTEAPRDIRFEVDGDGGVLSFTVFDGERSATLNPIGPS